MPSADNVIPPPREAEIQRQIAEWLTLQGALVVRINSGGIKATHNGKDRFFRFNSAEGCSDLLVCWKGRYLAIEVKRPGGKTDKERKARQEEFAARVRKAGGIAMTVTCIEDVQEALKALNWESDQ
jgi:Holliday junction resolvase